MQTNFTLAHLADPEIAVANTILRKCVHCGFCTATCPTYVLLGDELDSPRGRIYLIKDMLENGKPASAKVALHIDRCLSCLACMTTCPSGVHYMHLVDQARVRIAETFRRPWAERLVRHLLVWTLPHPTRFRWSLLAAWLAKPLAWALPARLKAMVRIAPRAIHPPAAVDRPQVFPAAGFRRKRVALLAGCVQQVLRPAINEATVRLLTRHGCEVVVAAGAGCCGALTHHMGRSQDALGQAKSNIRAWEAAERDGAFDAVVVNASGCGTMLKDYGHLMRTDPVWADRAERIAALAKDVTEVMADLGLKGATADPRPAVAYHSACSMQHGQGLKEPPKRLLAEAGFQVREPREAHLCCGSAGTYNLMQPELARQLRDRKAQHLNATGAPVIATGNIGCLMQLQGSADAAVVHTVELLDWATGGPAPKELSV